MDSGEKHKAHRAKSQKLKKREQKKKSKKKVKEERKQLKSLKKDKERLLKLKLITDQFAKELDPEDVYTVKKALKKLFKVHQQDAVRDIPELFKMVDEGGEVDISGLGDQYVIEKLNKICRLFKLKRDKENKLSFSKKGLLHEGLNLEKVVRHLFKEIEEEG